MQKNDYGFRVDEKVKKIDNEHYDEAIELEDGDDGEIGSGEEDEDQYQAGARGAQQAAQSVGFKKERFLYLLVLTIQMIIQIYKQVQKSNNCLSILLAPQVVLGAKLKPFIPDYVPAIGEVDAFIKMPRPDGQPETLGLVTLAKLDLLMREYVKVANRGKNTTIHAIENVIKIKRKLQPGLMMWQKYIKKSNLHLFHILKLCLILKNQCKSGLKKSKTYSKALNYQVIILIWIYKNIVNSHAICQIFLFIQLIIIEISIKKLFSYQYFYSDLINLKISIIIIDEKKLQFSNFNQYQNCLLFDKSISILEKMILTKLYNDLQKTS
ncbi:unnamed protein product [Paramecium pentaurelia]|uniref:Uncharacterized protein n=1 Tax=Paramecium pentaurelia TaxID=43138 RepID=A0A8S1Y040_9CILI|nr:unnamed protein product [Paramecium pentaurelia]